MASQSGFLRLPTELRCIVYRHYVVLQDGRYHYDFAHNKLTAANGEPIDLSLMYTCKAIAAEMKGVALNNNTISFTCVSSRDREEVHGLVYDYDNCIKSLITRKTSMFSHIRPCVSQSVSQSVYDELSRLFPQFVSVLDTALNDPSAWRREADKKWRPRDQKTLYNAFHRTWGDSVSAAQRFMNHAMHLASTHELFTEQIALGQGCRHASAMLSLPSDPAAIPTKECVVQMREMLYNKPGRYTTQTFGSLTVTDAPDEYDTMWKYRWSAAAAANYFLSSIPSSTRLQIRDIFLHENRRAVAYPESHAQCLIKFCKENSRLRIRRQVDLWRNAFQLGAKEMHEKRRYIDGLPSKNASDAIAHWTIEALALFPAGMPEGAYTMVFDGGPAPELCTRIFQEVVQRDAAWQIAWGRSYERAFKSAPSHAAWRTNWPFLQFPQAILDMTSRNSIVQCNFDPGQPWDVDALLQEHPTWTPKLWGKHRLDYPTRYWFTVPPLPEWGDLLWDSCDLEEVEEVKQWQPDHPYGW